MTRWKEHCSWCQELLSQPGKASSRLSQVRQPACQSHCHLGCLLKQLSLNFDRDTASLHSSEIWTKIAMEWPTVCFSSFFHFHSQGLLAKGYRPGQQGASWGLLEKSTASRLDGRSGMGCISPICGLSFSRRHTGLEAGAWPCSHG